MSIALLPGVRITSEICLLTDTLADKDNPLSDALLSDNSSNSQETFVEGGQFISDGLWGIYSVRFSNLDQVPVRISMYTWTHGLTVDRSTDRHLILQISQSKC